MEEEKLTLSRPHVAAKRRGAQPGNQNARKHGYYSKTLDEVGQAALSQLTPAADPLEAAFQRHNIKLNRLLALDTTNERVISAAGRRLLEFKRVVAVQQALRSNEPFRLAVRELLGKYGITPIFPSAATPENNEPGTAKSENAENNGISKEPRNEPCLPEVLGQHPHA